MLSEKPKTVDGLMRYLRDCKNIHIKGTSQKRKLMNMGYYHGYKGYRYIYAPSNQIPYKDFNELVAIYDFDTQLKSLFYPQVMFIETAIKNHVLTTLLHESGSDNFSVIYNKLLDNYKMFAPKGKKTTQKDEDKFKKELKRRLELRNRIYKVQTKAYGNGNKIADHYLTKDMNLPIWAIFELLSLGDFGQFVSCLNHSCREKISDELGIRKSDDTMSLLLQRLVYTIKDLRNSIAHNDVIFDTRFRTFSINKQVINAICNETKVSKITFQTITDYVILIVYIEKMLHVSKTDLKRFVLDFETTVSKLRERIPISIYSKIIYTDNSTKIKQIKKYISSN